MLAAGVWRDDASSAAIGGVAPHVGDGVLRGEACGGDLRQIDTTPIQAAERPRELLARGVAENDRLAVGDVRPGRLSQIDDTCGA